MAHGTLLTDRAWRGSGGGEAEVRFGVEGGGGVCVNDAGHELTSLGRVRVIGQSQTAIATTPHNRYPIGYIPVTIVATGLDVRDERVERAPPRTRPGRPTTPGPDGAAHHETRQS